jgi:hypothetical protein
MMVMLMVVVIIIDGDNKDPDDFDSGNMQWCHDVSKAIVTMTAII